MSYNFSKIKVLLIGDFMVDSYIKGESFRNSPEAPVPILIPNSDLSIPGGAGNVAMNLSSLGAKVDCIGTVGDDKWGEVLINKLELANVNCTKIKKIKDHQTTLKQRFYIKNKQAFRLDKEKYHEYNFNIKQDYVDNFDVIIISDYNKGVINKKIDFKSKLIIVDPKKDNFSIYRGAHIVTPNLNELRKSVNLDLKSDKSIISACNELINKFDFKYIVAKKGDKGMIVVGRGSFSKTIDSHDVAHPDVTGAGDTVISCLALSFAKSSNIKESAELANYAASISVSKIGTAHVTINDLNNYIKRDD